MKDAELKACPFCPGVGAATNDYDFGGLMYRVECDECECTTPVCDTAEDAARCWNTRADSAALSAAEQRNAELVDGLYSSATDSHMPSIQWLTADEIKQAQIRDAARHPVAPGEGEPT